MSVDRSSTDVNLHAVQDSFSAQSPVFDTIDEANPLIKWVRDRVRAEAMRYMNSGERMLEVNAGTGLDSIWFAERGIHVMATDNAPGMLAELERKKSTRPELPLEVMHCDFHQLEAFEAHSFDHVFSNFGGLNCTDRLDVVLRGIDHVLKPGGHCTLVIMPRTSPWELIELLRGNVRMAGRRFKKGGAPAQVEGVRFQCYYHDTSFVRRQLRRYRVRSLMALSFFVPPPHLAPFAARHPRFTRLLERLENATCKWPLLRGCGDHYLITLQKPLS